MKKIEEDILYVSQKAKELGLFNKSFLVTGATGMIGRLLVKILKKITENSKIYVLGLNFKEVESVYGDSGLILSSFEKLGEIKQDIDFVIHLASPTNPQYLKNNPVETINFIYKSTRRLLAFSRAHNSKMLYVSSMETYGEIYDENPKSEAELGYVNLNNTRSSYPEAKRLSELLCYSYSKEYQSNVCVARLAQTFGAGTSINDPRVFGYFGRCVVNNEDIVLKTKGDSFGNYCYIADTLSAFLFILARGYGGETYNVVGDNCRSSILDLANMVVEKISLNKIKVEFDLSNSSIYPNPTKLNMSNTKIKSLGWKPMFSLQEMFSRMIDSWNE